MSGEILNGSDLNKHLDLSTDVCVIGSGAGGATLAASLTAAGLDVVMLEAGGHFTRDDFVSLDEAWALSNLYQDRGTRGTEDRAITVLQGRSVGGGTTVNWTTCFRTPPAILDHWRHVHGIDLGSLDPHFDAVERRLNIHDWPPELVNPNNQVLIDGATALGMTPGLTRRNVYGCATSGYCGFGCPVNAKQGMLITTIPDAINAGMRLFADVEAHRLEVHRDRVSVVHARALDRTHGRQTGVRVTVHPKVVAVCGGAINSPALLLRSGLGDVGPVGRRTWLHPVVAVLATFDRDIHPFYGAPQSAYCHDRVNRGEKMGYFLEVSPLHPVMGGVSSSMFGDAQLASMSELHRASAPIAIFVDGLRADEPGGTVTLKRDGRVCLDYPITPALTEGFRDAHRCLTRVALAAGAREVRTTHPIGEGVITRESEISRLDHLAYGAHQHSIFTAHQMGGCAMGDSPDTSVVDAENRHHRLPNLFVVDGSVLPTGLGVNPSETLYALAHRAAAFVGEAV